MSAEEFYAFKGGLVTVSGADAPNGFALRIDTAIPDAKFRMRGSAVFDDAGLVAFSGEAGGSSGNMVLSTYREPTGLRVEFSASGVRGSVFFDNTSFDLTNLDLMVLEEKDVVGVEVGETVRVLDLLDLDVHTATVVTSVRRAAGAAVRRLGLDFDGEIHELEWDVATSELIGGRSNQVEWKRVAPAVAARHRSAIGA